MLKITQLYYFRLLQWVQKNDPQSFQNTPENKNFNYNMRHLYRKTPIVRTNYGKQHVEYQAPALLNRLHGLIDTSHIHSKAQMKSILLCHDIEYM